MIILTLGLQKISKIFPVSDSVLIPIPYGTTSKKE
jgi:hypothetical protein